MPVVGNPAGARPTTATVLFTDVVASTEVRRSHGDPHADELRRRHDEAIRAAAAEHLGEVVKGTGDGLMLVFPSATQGLSGAVAIQRSIDRLNRSRAGALMEIRVGLSAGDVVWEDDDCYGTPVVEAARLCDAAQGGTVLATEIVRLLAGSRTSHRLEPAGALQLKGLGEVTAYEVRWEPEAASAHLPLPQTLTAGETLPLIGRAGDIEAIQVAYKDAASGHPQVVLVAGEPGVGKTRLATEASRTAHAAGALVLFGRCDEDLSMPYQPFVEALTTFASSVDDDHLLSVLGPVGGELSRVVPSLPTRLGNRLSEPLRADAETERFRLFEAVVSFLHTLAADEPVVFLIDDAHWAARPTLLLLRHVIRARGSEKLLLLVTYRDTDLSRTHPLAETLADLRRESDIVRIPLRGLSADEVTDLVAAAAGHDLDEAAQSFAGDVHAETEGNPFFVGQVLRHLAESGAIRIEDERWVVDRSSAVGIPEGVREVIGRRLSRLSPKANDVLAAAAVIGREFDRRLLAEATDTDRDEVLDVLEQAEATRLVVPVPGSDRLAFNHALVRTTLYDEIPTTRRLRIHRRIADALEARANRGVPCIEELAHHSREAAGLGDVERAVRWSSAAAEAAAARLAYEEAAAHYQQALDVLDPDDRAHVEVRADLRVRLAQAIRLGGTIPAARAVALDAVADSRAARRPDLLLGATLVMAGDRGWTEAGIVDREIIGLFEEGITALGAGDSTVKAKAMARLASELYFDVPSAERRQALTDEALAMAERLRDDETKLFVSSCSLWGSWVPGNAEARKDRALAVATMGRASGNRLHELIGLMYRVAALAELGDGDGMRAEVAAETVIAEELRVQEWLWPTRVHATALALMDCRFDEATALAEEALRIGSAVGTATATQMYGVALFALHRARGGYEPLVGLTEAMVAQYPLIPAWRCALGFLYAQMEMVEQTREVFEHFAADDFTAIPFDANWLIGVGLLAMSAVVIPGVVGSELLYELLLPYRESVMTAGMPGEAVASTHLALMMLATALANWDAAEEHYASAQATHQRMGNRYAHLNTELQWARLLHQRGRAADAERVTKLATACRDVARSVDAPYIEAQAQSLLE